MLLSANIFQPLINIFQDILKFFNSMGLSWGWAIVLLTVCVRLVLMPLTVKQFQSMRRLQAHQPEMKAIQQKYKDDKQMQQQEMMKFYSENNVNPFASCLPMVLQLPVFMALYYMLRKNLRDDICPSIQAAARQDYATKHGITLAAAHGHSVACGHVPDAAFLFLKDITTTATGVSLVILLVLYVGTQLLSTILMQQPGMDKSQQRMMMFLPLIFVFFIMRFPAGLMVYWITTNIWTVGQGLAMKRWIGIPQVAVASGVSGGAAGDKGTGSVAPAKKSGFGSIMARMQAQASERNGTSAKADGKPVGGGKSAGAASGKGKAPASSKGTATTSGSVSGAVKGAGDGAAPPPPPRKKKKRSGRRR